MPIKKKNNDKNIIREGLDVENIKLVKTVVSRSDEVIVDIYHFINKTVEMPNKNEIAVYRKSLINLLSSQNDEKFNYIYQIAAKAVFDFKEKEKKLVLQLQNEVMVSPNIFTISWADVNDNIKRTLQDENDINPETIKYAFIEEHRRLQDLKNKINKMIQLGIDVPNAKDLEVTEKTFLKLTDLVNIFMLENFSDVSSMVQEIEIFEKHYNVEANTANSVYMDANYKKISNLPEPELSSDAVNKAYVDNQIKILNDKINQLKSK